MSQKRARMENDLIKDDNDGEDDVVLVSPCNINQPSNLEKKLRIGSGNILHESTNSSSSLSSLSPIAALPLSNESSFLLASSSSSSSYGLSSTSSNSSLLSTVVSSSMSVATLSSFAVTTALTTTSSLPSSSSTSSTSSTPSTPSIGAIDNHLWENYSLYKELLEKYKCIVCLVMYPKIYDTKCNHVLCPSCAADLSTNKCPECRQSLGRKKEKTTLNGLLSRDIGSLNLRCWWSGDRGFCKLDKISYQNWLKHCTNECPERLVSCSFCGIQHRFNDTDNHRSNQCLSRQVTCMLCQQFVRIQDMSNHMDTDCPKMIIKCPHPNCSTQVERSSMEFHSQTCGEAMVQCPICTLLVLPTSTLSSSSTSSSSSSSSSSLPPITLPFDNAFSLFSSMHNSSIPTLKSLSSTTFPRKNLAEHAKNAADLHTAGLFHVVQQTTLKLSTMSNLVDSLYNRINILENKFTPPYLNSSSSSSSLSISSMTPLPTLHSTYPNDWHALINGVNNKWGLLPVLVADRMNKWYLAHITNTIPTLHLPSPIPRDATANIHFSGFGSRWDENVQLFGGRIRPVQFPSGSQKMWLANLGIGDIVSIRKIDHKGEYDGWCEAKFVARHTTNWLFLSNDLEIYIPTVGLEARVVPSNTLVHSLPEFKPSFFPPFNCECDFCRTSLCR